MNESAKIFKFVNIERGRLRNQIYFNLSKDAYAIFALCFLIYYLNISLVMTLILIFTGVLIYIRVSDFKRMQDEQDILALEIGPQFMLLDCGQGDFQLNYSKIEQFLIKKGDKLHNYYLSIKLKKDVEQAWPERLYDYGNLKIPSVFDEDLFYIINHSEDLKKLCKNYKEAQSFLQYDHELRYMERED